ncbi:hypothetical protein P8452_22155 [Trifolium repens]|nr:hypothetical protein P8452_22155 [Trifolium repens]
MASSSKGNGVDKDNGIRNTRDSFARSLTKKNDKYCARPAETQEIRLRIYHGGLFIDSPCKMYVKGQMDEMNWGVDFTSYKDVVELVKSLGYRDFKCLYYRHPQLALSRGLRPLNCDDNVLTFIEDIKGYEVVEVYLEHLVDTPILIEEDIHDKGNGKQLMRKWLLMLMMNMKVIVTMKMKLKVDLMKLRVNLIKLI